MNKRNTRILTRRHSIGARQRGAALVIGLILLLVLTLLAVSGMNTATLELQMAGNSQFSQNAFQAAETGIEAAMQTNLVNTNVVITSPVTAIPGTNDTYQTVTRFNPDTGVQNTLVVGSSAGEFAFYHFDVTSTGTSGRGATSTNTQSFYVQAPKTE